MEYNEKYVSDYPEQSYLKFLLDPKLLNGLVANYKHRYEQDKKVDGSLILLNHYLHSVVV